MGQDIMPDAYSNVDPLLVVSVEEGKSTDRIQDIGNNMLLVRRTPRNIVVVWKFC